MKVPDETWATLGKRVYEAYLAVEQDNSRITITAHPDGAISTPEGLIEVYERIIAADIRYPGDKLVVHTDPAKTFNVKQEPDSAEGRSGGQEGS